MAFCSDFEQPSRARQQRRQRRQQRRQRRQRRRRKQQPTNHQKTGSSRNQSLTAAATAADADGAAPKVVFAFKTLASKHVLI